MATYKVRTRVPVVVHLEDEDTKTHAFRLVEAKTRAQAIAHVVADTIEAEVCTIAEAVELGAAGVKVENAGEVAP